MPSVEAQSSKVSDIQKALSKFSCNDALTGVNLLEKEVLKNTSKQGEVALIIHSSYIKDVPESNTTFYLPNDDIKKVKDLNKLKEKLTTFLDLLPAVDSWKEDAFLIQTIKENNDELLVLIYKVEDKLIGYISRLDNNYIGKAFENAKNILDVNQVCLYGDNIENLNIYEIADKYNFEILRRSSYVDTEIPSFISNINPLQSQIFEPANSVAFNCVPTSREELINAGFSPDNAPAWETLKNKISENTNGKFIDKPTSVLEFKNELINGQSDALLLVAHSDKISLYIGNQKVEIDEIKSWEERQIKNNKPRVAILLSCYAGEIEQLKSKWFFFQSQRESLTEVLLKKKYFDYIISPNHQISGDEVFKILTEILKNPSVSSLRNLFAGWHAYVFIEKK